MPAPKKFENNLMAEKSDDSLVPISETLQQNTIKIHPHTNTDHITSLSPPKVTPKFYPHGQDGPKRKITPILTAPAYTSPQRTRRFGKTDNVFSEIKLKTPKKRAVEIFDSSKMRAPKLIQPSGLLSSKIEEVNPQDTVKMDASKVTKTDPVEMKIATDTSNMTSANKNDNKATNSAKNDKQDSKMSPQENLEEFKTDISKEQKAQHSETKETVSPIAEQIAPKPSADIPKPSADIPKPSADILQQKLKMPEIIVLDNVSMSKKATDNQTVSQPILTTTETSGNRHQTIAISVAGPKVSRTSGKADFGTDSSSREIPDPTPSKTAGQKIPETTDMSAGGQSKGSKESSGKTITGREASEVSASKTNQPKENNGSEAPAVSVKEQNDSPKGFSTSSEKNVSDGQAENPEEVIRNTVPKVSAPRQTLVSEDSMPKDVSIETSSILQSSVSAVVHDTTSMGTSLSIQDTSEKEKDKRNSAVSVISVSKSKGIITKHDGSSSLAKETRSKGTHKDQKSEETTIEREQKSLDGQKPLNDSSDSHRNHGPSETLVQKTWDRNSEDAGVKDQQSTEMLNWSKAKDVKRKTSLHIMSTATEKKRRDSVAYLPTRPTPAPTKQRRVSLATNPSIPKRRTSVHEQLSTKTEVSNFSQKLTNLLKESGFGYKLEESSLKLEIPVCKISNDHQEIQVVSETSLKDGVRSLKPGVTILNDGWLDEEFLTLLKTRLETGDSIKRKTSLTELVPETQSKDIQKDNEAVQSIESVIKEMIDNPTDYDIQLKNSQIISKYFDGDCIKVLVNKKDIIQVILTAITTFQDRQSLQTLACMSLLKIASISESNCEILKECEGLSTLNTIFKCYNDNITVQKLILTTWAYMSATESLCKDMLNYGIHTEILETMSRRPDDSNIIKQSCFILANLVNTEETAKQIMLVGGVHTVINVIEKYHQHSAILENGCRALGSFAAFDETCLDVAQAGATKTVVSILHDTIENLSVQECSLWALACLTSIAETCEEVINMDADEAVLDSLQRYPLEENIQEYGVRIISNLASIESTSSEINSRRVLDILMKMLTNYSNSLCILEHTFVTIGQTVLTFEDQKYLLESGGITQIINTMEKFNEHSTILEHGCRIIGNMAVFEKLRSKVECYGASKAVINAMLLLDQISEIQLCGCMALMNLTANVRTNKLNLLKHGGVSSILSCLDNFSTDSEILLTALKTLTNIISLENACQSVVEKNGVHLLLSLANTTNFEPEIYSYIATVLSGLTSLKELEFDILENIDTALIKILNQYPDSADITLAFCQTMENILASELGRKMFIYEDRLSLILKYTTQFIYHSHIQQIGCKILAIIAMDKDNYHVIRPDCIKCLLSVSIIHHDNLELQILTCGAISCILESNSDMGRIVEEENGINQIMKNLNQHQTDSRLHVLALMILANLSFSAKKEDSQVIFEIVLKTMTQFTENVEIQSYACHVLWRLPFSYNTDQLSRVLNSIRNTLKRHSHEAEVVKTAGKVLHKISQDGHQAEVDNVLKSPSLPQLPEFFWQSVKSVS